MPAFTPRTPIALTGFMGSGKTTVGRMLAERLGWRFVDLDSRIVDRAGLSIVQIFRDHGEPAFRYLETEMLERALGEAGEQGRHAVIALGGGTLTRPENVARLRQAAAMLVWLDCPVEELLLRCAAMTDRPLFTDEAGFRRLYEERRPLYSQSEYRVDAATEPARVVERILAHVRPAAVEA